MSDFEGGQLAGTSTFLRRLSITVSIGLLIVCFSLSIGMAGYHITERLPWIDAFLNASMILSGMGPIDKPVTEDGKLFAGIYALYSGLIVILSATVAFSPVIHRLFHRFHLEDTDSEL